MNFKIMKARLRIALLAGLTSIVPILSAQESPYLIPFQGRLTDQQGTAYDQGQYTITFNLYSQAVGGSSEWTERHEKVGVVNGMINVFLGSIEALDTMNFSATKHLGITVDADSSALTADPEMVPRQMIIPAIHAKNAQKVAGHDWTTILEGGSNDPSSARIAANRIQVNGITANEIASGAVGSDEIAANSITGGKIADGSIDIAELTAALQRRLVPPGTIAPYGGASAPAGWFFCHNQLLDRTTYSDLYDAIGTAWGTTNGTNFRVPDLRGLFLRGRAAGHITDPDRNNRTVISAGGNTGDNVGSYQLDMYKAHTHNFPVRNEDATGNKVESSAAGGISGTVTTNSSGGSETRPKNAYVNYIIKY